MKKQYFLLIILVFLLSTIIYLSLSYINKQPLIGNSCGTVTPGDNDECCYRKFKDNNNFPLCKFPLIFYNFEEQKCDFKCRASKDIVCAADVKSCPDNSFTSRTPVLNCSFIPCGYS